MKPTPAEQHIAEQSERRDLTSICQRLARLEDRLAAVDRKAAGAQKGVALAFEHLESVKESLEGAWERIQALILRVDAKMLRDVGIPQDLIDELMREPGKAEPVRGVGPAKPFDFGADLRIDLDIVSGKREPDARENPQWTPEEIARFKREWAGSKHAQEVYNRRQSELLARAAADRARGQAYYALYDVICGDRATGAVLQALNGLFIALGRPNRIGVDHAED